MHKLKLPKIKWPWRRRALLSDRTWGIIIVSAIILIVVAVVMTNRPTGERASTSDDETEASVTAAADGDAAKKNADSLVAAPAPKEDGCQNAFYPMTKGYRVEYGSVVKNKVTPAFRMQVADQVGQAARQTFDFGGAIFQLDLACSGGNIVPKQYLDLMPAFGKQKLDIVTKEVQGALLPKELAKDKPWKLKYVVSVKTEDAKLIGAGYKDVTYLIDETRRVISSNEKLTTPAGTFEVVRVQVDQAITAQLPANSAVKIDAVHRSFLAFYGKNAGLLRLVEQGKLDLVASKTGM